MPGQSPTPQDIAPNEYGFEEHRPLMTDGSHLVSHAPGMASSQPKPGDTDMHRAIRAGDWERLQQRLHSGDSLFSRNNDGETPAGLLSQLKPNWLQSVLHALSEDNAELSEHIVTQYTSAHYQNSLLEGLQGDITELAALFKIPLQPFNEALAVLGDNPGSVNNRALKSILHHWQRLNKTLKRCRTITNGLDKAGKPVNVSSFLATAILMALGPSMSLFFGFSMLAFPPLILHPGFVIGFLSGTFLSAVAFLEVYRIFKPVHQGTYNRPLIGQPIFSLLVTVVRQFHQYFRSRLHQIESQLARSVTDIINGHLDELMIQHQLDRYSVNGWHQLLQHIDGEHPQEQGPDSSNRRLKQSVYQHIAQLYEAEGQTVQAAIAYTQAYGLSAMNADRAYYKEQITRLGPFIQNPSDDQWLRLCNLVVGNTPQVSGEAINDEVLEQFFSYPVLAKQASWVLYHVMGMATLNDETKVSWISALVQPRCREILRNQTSSQDFLNELYKHDQRTAHLSRDGIELVNGDSGHRITIDYARLRPQTQVLLGSLFNKQAHGLNAQASQDKQEQAIELWRQALSQDPSAFDEPTLKAFSQALNGALGSPSELQDDHSRVACYYQLIHYELNKTQPDLSQARAYCQSMLEAMNHSPLTHSSLFTSDPRHHWYRWQAEWVIFSIDQIESLQTEMEATHNDQAQLNNPSEDQLERLQQLDRQLNNSANEENALDRTPLINQLLSQQVRQQLVQGYRRRQDLDCAIVTAEQCAQRYPTTANIRQLAELCGQRYQFYHHHQRLGLAEQAITHSGYYWLLYYQTCTAQQEKEQAQQALDTLNESMRSLASVATVSQSELMFYRLLVQPASNQDFISELDRLIQNAADPSGVLERIEKQMRYPAIKQLMIDQIDSVSELCQRQISDALKGVCLATLIAEPTDLTEISYHDHDYACVQPTQTSASVMEALNHYLCDPERLKPSTNEQLANFIYEQCYVVEKARYETHNEIALQRAIDHWKAAYNHLGTAMTHLVAFYHALQVKQTRDNNEEQLMNQIFRALNNRVVPIKKEYGNATAELTNHRSLTNG